MAGKPDVLLVDYHLHDHLDGLDTLDALRAGNRQLPGALLTADGSDTLKQAARARGYRVLTKPVKPASLRAFLSAQRSLPGGGGVPPAGGEDKGQADTRERERTSRND